MKIVSSQVAAASQHKQTYKSSRKETVLAPPTDTVDLTGSKAGQAKQASPTSPASKVGEPVYMAKGLSIMKMLVERMMGKSMELFSSEDFQGKIDDINNQNLAAQQPPIQGQGNNGGGNGGNMVIIEQYEFESESNQLAFSGNIQTADGREISFDFALSFSQKHETLSVEMSRQAENLKDPLVISFTSKPVTLSNKRFEFDIDADGQTDRIPQLSAGNGFLVLDKNQDGQINDGNELFGALSGNGFADLASYDDDGNGFIDEGDKVFSQLQIWVKNPGEDKLVSLKDANIGAIALQHVDSPYTVREGDEKLGIIRKSGFYLNENGGAGLVQQLDFVV